MSQIRREDGFAAPSGGRAFRYSSWNGPMNHDYGTEHGIERMLTGLLEASHLAALEQVPALVAEHARHAGMEQVLIYLVDVQQTELRLLTGRGNSAGEDACPEPTEL